ncbi:MULTISPECIES: A24 family peptidase [Jeotgalibaca]
MKGCDKMRLMLMIYYFFIGSCFASFYCVIADRLPRKESLIAQQSFCSSCKHPLAFFDLIPVLSFLSLRGRCRYCQKRIKSNLLLFEVIGGSIFIITASHYQGFTFVFYSCFYSILFLVAVIDYYYFYIPDCLQLLLFIFTFFYHFANDSLNQLPIWFGIVMMLIVGISASWFVPNGLGGGDMKLMAIFGFYFGFYASSATLCLASLMGIVYLFILSRYKSTLFQPLIPFGPFLALSFFMINEYFYL